MMRRHKLLQTFHDRYPLLGPLIWMLDIQYFVTQIIVAAAWSHPFSLRFNTISDLGNTACGLYNGRLVCSPWHNLMNASFITLGVTMAVGSMLIYQEFRQRPGSRLGFTFMGLAGVGTVLVGSFPENTLGNVHLLGAALPFLVGNLGLVILSFALDIPKSLRIYTFLSGSLALVALGFFASHHYLSLGEGGMERLTAYPQTLWLIVFGAYISRNHYKTVRPAVSR